MSCNFLSEKKVNIILLIIILSLSGVLQWLLWQLKTLALKIFKIRMTAIIIEEF